MDIPFLHPTELNLLKRDYHQAVHHDSSVTILYHTYLDSTDPPVIDPVYHTDERELDQTQVVREDVPCITKIVHERDLKILGFGIVEVGDCIFYFPDNLNLLEPVLSKPVAPGTLYFRDALGNEWMPILKDTGPLRRYLTMVQDDNAISQVVPCTLRR